MIIVSDTSPITNLAAIDRLDLLQKLYTTIIIPTAVYREMVLVDQAVPGAIEVQTLSWIQTRSVVNSQNVIELLNSQNHIDLGEVEAIVLSLELKANLLLMDERRGRALAAEYKLNVTGLLGVLLQARHNGLIEQVQPSLDRRRNRPLVEGLIAS